MLPMEQAQAQVRSDGCGVADVSFLTKAAQLPGERRGPERGGRGVRGHCSGRVFTRYRPGVWGPRGFSSRLLRLLSG